MKKFIVAFGMGIGMCYLVMMVGLRLTYSTNLPAFVFAVCAVVLIALIIGSVGTAMENMVTEDEVAPLPDEIKVTNDSVERDEKKPFLEKLKEVGK